MSMVLGLSLIIFTGYIGLLMWSTFKAKRIITGMLASPSMLNGFILALFDGKFFDKKMDEISNMAGMWSAILSKGGTYDLIINMEFASSMKSYNIYIYRFSIGLALIIIIEALSLPWIYALVSVIVAVVAYVVPLSELGKDRAYRELGVLSWLMGKFNSYDSHKCCIIYCFDNNTKFRNLYNAITRNSVK